MKAHRVWPSSPCIFIAGKMPPTSVLAILRRPIQTGVGMKALSSAQKGLAMMLSASCCTFIVAAMLDIMSLHVWQLADVAFLNRAPSANASAPTCVAFRSPGAAGAFATVALTVLNVG